MRFEFRRYCPRAAVSGLLLISLGATGCVSLPDIPGDRTLPMREILEHATCELRDALDELTQPRFERFEAKRWLVEITLMPKAEKQMVAGAGGSVKSSTQPVTALKNLITWAIGTPGLQVDTKGQRTTSVKYQAPSSQIMEDDSLVCDRASENYHALARHLGIRDWLTRSVIAMERTRYATLSDPTFSATITVKFSGNGNYSYAFLEGSGFLTMSGNYLVEEQLSIKMTRIPKTPPGMLRKRDGLEVTGLEAAQQNLMILRLEEAIRGLTLEAR